MDTRVLKILEYDKILESLAQRAVSELGKAAALDLLPSADYSQVWAMLEETAQAYCALERQSRNPVDAFPDVVVSLQKAGATASLGSKELMEIARLMRASRVCKETLLKEDTLDRLMTLAGELHSCRAVEEEINRCILAEDEISDSASSTLSKLRRQMKNCNAKAREKLNAMVHSAQMKTYLQEPIITVRNGRFVLPVKQEYRSMVPGLLHDSSGSGATLFIEPSAVVELGNELKQLQGEEEEEIYRILAELTQLVAPHASALQRSSQVLVRLDVIFAKASLSKAMNGVQPKLNQHSAIRIAAGRHPLIDPALVVPIDLWLGEDFKTLIVTGPNTGGKTVTLKTVGLFSLMAQSGMFLPAASASCPVFENVFADIGDEQSIAQSLSTFSSHMRNIVEIMNNSGAGSLILLDELGSGTDPVEGAALAMAVLEELHSRSCLTLATTHYSELKAFALTREGIENASMEFDVRTLRPTYRLFVGIPGKSNAFEISAKLGLAPRLIESAQKYLEKEDVAFEDVISSAQSQRRIAEEERKLAEEARSELYRLRDAAQAEKKKLAEQRDKLMAKARDDAKRLVMEAKRESERIVKELKQAGDTQAEINKAVSDARTQLRVQQDKLRTPEDVEEKKDYGPPPKAVIKGDTVYVITLDQKATVLDPQSSKGEVSVQAGILKLNVKLNDLRIVKSADKGVAARAHTSLESKAIPMEFDIRGMSVEEAVMDVDKYIDDACIAGVPTVSIIHGKGTGMLRSGIHAYLKRNPRVKEFRLGRYGEGEGGVTVVTLKI